MKIVCAETSWSFDPITGSSWTNTDLLHVGLSGDRSRLILSNEALFFSSVGVSVGDTASSTNNRVLVDGGTLLLNNTNATASLEVRRGTNVLNAGLIDVGQLLDDLDTIVRESGGAVYPAKDARMSAENFQAFFPKWREFAGYVDPHFSSSFWRRVSFSEKLVKV